MNSKMNFVTDIQTAYGDTLTEKDAEAFSKNFRHEWSDDSDRGCSDCPEDECTGHCTSCFYRPV